MFSITFEDQFPVQIYTKQREFLYSFSSKGLRTIKVKTVTTVLFSIRCNLFDFIQDRTLFQSSDNFCTINYRFFFKESFLLFYILQIDHLCCSFSLFSLDEDLLLSPYDQTVACLLDTRYVLKISNTCPLNPSLGHFFCRMV